MTSYDYAVATTQGSRDYQEDAAAFWANGAVQESASGAGSAGAVLTGSFAVLADGMGGHAGGAIASKLACDHFLAAVSASSGSVAERLSFALDAANCAIADRVDANPSLSGMGSTLIGTAFYDHGVAWISVGDSPLYLYRRGELRPLNEDHSFAPELERLVSEGLMTGEQARRDPRRHMLRSAVTGDDIDMIDLAREPVPLEHGDYVVLASDGVETLAPEQIARVIEAASAGGAEAVASALIKAVEAMRQPHQDNATVLVVGVRSDAG